MGYKPFNILLILSALVLSFSTCSEDSEETIPVVSIPEGFPAACNLTSLQYFSNSNLTDHYEYDFNEDGYTTQLRVYDPDSLRITFNYERDPLNRINSARSYGQNGLFISGREYHYEDDNQIIPTRLDVLVADNGNETLVQEWNYEFEGNKISEITLLSPDGELKETRTYTYEDSLNKYTIEIDDVDDFRDGKYVYTYYPEQLRPDYSVSSLQDFTSFYALDKAEFYEDFDSPAPYEVITYIYYVDESEQTLTEQKVYMSNSSFVIESMYNYDCGQ